MKGIKQFLWKMGLHVNERASLANALTRREKLFAKFAIDAVLDVGANEGQYAQELRNMLQFKGRIISFEPLSTAFEVLAAKSASDDGWTSFNFALGDVEAQQDINVSGNSQSSSFLPMLAGHEATEPSSRYIDTQTVSIKRLDDIFESLDIGSSSVYLKIDAQGFEEKVLKGATASLALVDTLQVEMSLVPLYTSELLYVEMIELLAGLGYELVGLEPGFTDPDSGRLMQADGIFHRSRG